VQPIKEMSSAAGLCAGRGCPLIRQLANRNGGCDGGGGGDGGGGISNFRIGLFFVLEYLSDSLWPLADFVQNSTAGHSFFKS